MKQAASLLILVVYALSVAGISISHHYCGGKLKSIEINKVSDSHKCCGKKKMPEGCCKDVGKLYKLDNEHAKAKVVFNSYTPFVAVLSFFTGQSKPRYTPWKAKYYLPDHAPPYYPGNIYLLNNRLLI